MSPFSIIDIEYELEETLEIKDLFERPERIIERTGIEKVYKTNISSENLALKAATKVLDRNNINPDVLIYVTQSQKYILQVPAYYCMIR